MAQENEDFSKLTFKEGMDELESIVRELESGSLELEVSLEKYARGVKLLSDMQSRLNDAQQKVEVLMGELEEAPADEVQDTTLCN